jgi:anti-anti-sigma regulatory factor
MEAHLELTLTFNGKKALLVVNGMVTTDNAHLLHNEFENVLNKNVEELDIDFSQCRILCSTGIGKLMMFTQTFIPKGGKVQIIKCSENVYDLFTTIKLDQILTIKK